MISSVSRVFPRVAALTLPALTFAALVVVILAFAGPAFAQQRPLVTEDPETIGAGRVLIEGGVDYGRGVEYPVSGLTGQLLRVPLIGVSVGISSIAELQFDGGLHNRLAITERVPAPLSDMVTATGDTTSSVEDLVVATKIRVASALVGKTVRSVRTVVNGGFGILGDPVDGTRQNDVVTYGVSFARALTQAAEVVGEVNGRIDLRGDEPARPTNTRGAVRLGARYTVGGWRGDAAVVLGLTSRDPGIGVAAGFTYVFSAFRVP